MDTQPTDPSNTNQPAPLPVAPPAQPAPAAPTVAQLPAWPGAFGIFKTSRAAVRLNLGTLVLIYAASFILSIIFSAFHVPVLSIILSFVVSAVTTVAYTLTLLAGVRGQRVDVGNALQGSWPLAMKAFLLNILVALIVGISFLLLIIPGLIIAPRLALSSYFLVDQKLSPVDAIKASWAATKGHASKVWGIVGVAILMILPSITIIGILATIYLFIMYSAVLACLYVFLAKPQPAAA